MTVATAATKTAAAAAVRAVIVRAVADSFATGALSAAPPPEPIAVAAAREQHAAYVAALKRLAGSVVELPSDERHPDCCFVEDAAVVVPAAGSSGTASPPIAIVARIGAPERAGEEAPVAAALEALGCTMRHLEPLALLDGGDVLQLPGGGGGRNGGSGDDDDGAILVGLSKRTNAAAVEQLQRLLPWRRVVGVPLPGELLHLKTGVTALDAGCFLLADTPAAHVLSDRLSHVLPELAGWRRVFLPAEDAPCANIVRVGSKDVVAQDGQRAETRAALERECAERGLRLHLVPALADFAKADGSATCLSIVVP